MLLRDLFFQAAECVIGESFRNLIRKESCARFALLKLLVREKKLIEERIL